MVKRTIEIVEVGPRDGLQNEAQLVPTADKVDLIRRCIAAGARRIEVASFVNPRKVPHPELGAITLQAPMPKIFATPSAVRRPAPRRVGEHNAPVYGPLGYDQAELAGLAVCGVI